MALASLFIVTMVMDAIYSHIRFDQLLQDFLSIFYMAIIGANYEFLDSPYGLGLIYVFPFIFVIIVSIVVLIFVNYTFVYRKFGIVDPLRTDCKYDYRQYDVLILCLRRFGYGLF